MAEFKCKECSCVTNGHINIKTDNDKKVTWDNEHAARLELRDKQEIILAEFESIVEQHNSHWYNRIFTKWHVSPRPFGDSLDIVDFTKEKPIKSVPYDNTVMGYRLYFIYQKPSFEYIECPICHYRKYIREGS